MEEIKVVTDLGSQPEYQEYADRDLNLIEQGLVNPKFTLFSNDYIEFFIQDAEKNILAENYDAHSYDAVAIDPVNSATNTLELDPEADIAAYGIDRGTVNITYNFFTKLFGSDIYSTFWIAEISDNRTEIRVVRNDLSNQELRNEFTKYQQTVSSLPYYPDFLLNFGSNRILIGINMLFAQPADEASLLIKLYEPLPDDISTKDTFWLVNKLAEPVSYNIDIQLPEEVTTSTHTLRGPNFDIEIKKTVGQTTDLYNYNTLFGLGNSLLPSATSSFNQIKSLLEEKSIDINVDYSDFSNFIHFSSATERLYNFQYKLQQIELNQAYIAASGSISGSIASNSTFACNTAISNIIEKLDEYEYYLYYSISTKAWPKYFDISTDSYYNYSVTSSQAANWLGDVDVSGSGTNMLYEASLYDKGNPDYLVNTLPAYIREDAENNPAFLFTSMLGQHFDNLYVYYKDITNRFNATNDIHTGISKDLVGDALKALGIKLYTNSNISDNIYYSILGITPEGDTSVYSFPTGSEGGVSGSLTRVSMPYLVSGSSMQDIQTETYKRIYHNLPYLLKTKGTERGLKALISCFGIPDTLLRVVEFGGVTDKTSLGSNVIHQHNEGLYSQIINQDNTYPALVVPWGPVGYDYLVSGEQRVPETFQLRFKSINGVPTASYDGTTYGDAFYSSSTAVFHVGSGSSTQWGVQLSYISTTASQYSPLASLGITGSAVSGSPYENYGYMSLWLSGSAGYVTSSPLYLPFYDKTLSWNIYAYRETSSLTSVSSSDNRYWIYAEAPLYNAQGAAIRGFRGSASIDITGASTNLASASYNNSWNLNNSSSFGSSSLYSQSFSSGSSPSSSWATSSFYSSSLGGIYAGYLGGNMVGIKPFASASYDGVFQELRYWRSNLTDTAKAQHAFYAESTVGNNETASLYDLVYRIKLTEYQTPDSPYFVSNLVTSNYAATYLESVFADIPSIHPAVVGHFDLPGNPNLTSVPSFYLFSDNDPKIPVNGAAYTSSNFATNYVAYDSYELVTTPQSGPTQKVNTKVTTPTQYTITGSTLSPYVSIEKLDPSRTANSSNIEVAFSPADQIDDDIAQQFGTFNIDQYIGSPADAYSSSYADLNNLKKTYFSKYVDAYNVYDLVRAIKFYDNSLFKMIKDFVPMRANLSTGVVIKSHLLERNKVARHEPIIDFVSHSGSIDTAFISGSNGTGKSYNTSYTETIAGLTGSVTQRVTDNAAMFTGRFGGATISISHSFAQKLDSTISNTTTVQDYIPSASLNYLFNNVTASRASVNQFDLDYSYRADVPVNLSLIQTVSNLQATDPSALRTGFWPWSTIQDSDYSRFSYRSARYIGSKTSSSLYNTYSISDAGISDIDKAYGKTAAIGSYTKKLGLFTQVVSSSFFSQKNNFALIYLVDESGSFVELNTDNKNWEELQNTFKQGSRATVKLFDNQKYSDQRTTEGIKPIFNSGYSYKPMVYYNQGLDTRLYFTTTTGNGPSAPRQFAAVNSLLPNNSIKGITSPTYPLVSSASVKAIYKIFDSITLNEGDHYAVGSAGSWPSYTISENGSYKFTASINLAVTHSITGSTVSYTFDVISTNPTIVLGSSTKTTSNAGASLTIGSGNRAYVSCSRDGNTFQTYTYVLPQNTTLYSSDGVTALDYYPSGTYLYVATGSTDLYISNSIYGNIGRDLHIVYATSPQYTASFTGSFFTNVVTSTTGSVIRTVNNPDNKTYYYVDNALILESGGNIMGGGPFTSSIRLGTSTASLDFTLSTGNQALLSGSSVEFRLYENYSTYADYTASIISPGALGVATTTQISGLYPYALSSNTDGSVGNFISRSIYPNTFILNKEISNMYGYTFLPGFSSGSTPSSSLYYKYGDVDYAFNLALGDVLIVQQGSYTQEFDIVSTYTSADGALNLTVSPEINDVFISNLPETASFLTKRRDESNLILSFPKKAGTTSYGIVIPDNLSPEVLKNIDTITKEIQQKLIDVNGVRQSDVSTSSSDFTATATPTPTPTPGPGVPTATPTPTPGGGPTATPTPTPTPGATSYSKLLNNSSTQPNSTPAEACTAYNTYNRRMYYSAASFFTNGMTLYLDSGLTSIAPNGYYSDGANAYFFSGGTWGGGSTPC